MQALPLIFLTAPNIKKNTPFNEFYFQKKSLIYLTTLTYTSIKVTHIKHLCLLLPFLFLVHCTDKPIPGTTEFSASDSVSYLALGDSYTIGESVEESLRWPVQLSDSLADKGFTIEQTDIIARTGWTTAELQEGITAVDPDSSFDLVSLLIGVNNQYRGYDIEIYRTEFRELLQRAIALASGDPENVFVVSIPNYGVTPFGSRNEDTIRQELLEYDAIARSISSEYEIPFINITPISEAAKEDSTLIAEDQLHPSGKMYTLWVSEMLPAVRELLMQ